MKSTPGFRFVKRAGVLLCTWRFISRADITVPCVAAPLVPPELSAVTAVAVNPRTNGTTAPGGAVCTPAAAASRHSSTCVVVKLKGL
jgi:hypothetical protein